MNCPELQAENMAVMLRDGPRISTLYNVWVEAKDLKNKMVLLGGLGCMGVGQMWSPLEKRHRQYPGFKEAVKEVCPPSTVKRFQCG